MHECDLILFAYDLTVSGPTELDVTVSSAFWINLLHKGALCVFYSKALELYTIKNGCQDEIMYKHYRSAYFNVGNAKLNMACAGSSKTRSGIDFGVIINFNEFYSVQCAFLSIVVLNNRFLSPASL